MGDVPLNAGRFPTAKFSAWLVERGAEILKPTNEYEVLRVRTETGTHVLYRNDRMGLTWPSALETAWRSWRAVKPWQAFPHPKRRTKSVAPLVRTIIARDGTLCFYCLQEMADDDMTVEHIVPLAHGGPNHLSNYVLAHRSCNQDAGHLSGMEKIKRRELAGVWITL